MIPAISAVPPIAAAAELADNHTVGRSVTSARCSTHDSVVVAGELLEQLTYATVLDLADRYIEPIVISGSEREVYC